MAAERVAGRYPRPGWPGSHAPRVANAARGLADADQALRQSEQPPVVLALPSRGQAHRMPGKLGGVLHHPRLRPGPPPATHPMMSPHRVGHRRTGGPMQVLPLSRGRRPSRPRPAGGGYASPRRIRVEARASTAAAYRQNTPKLAHGANDDAGSGRTLITACPAVAGRNLPTSLDRFPGRNPAAI